MSISATATWPLHAAQVNGVYPKLGGFRLTLTPLAMYPRNPHANFALCPCLHLFQFRMTCSELCPEILRFFQELVVCLLVRDRDDFGDALGLGRARCD